MSKKDENDNGNGKIKPDKGNKWALPISLFAVIVSIVSVVETRFINTARFEVFEDLKYEQLQMVANLKSIETKAFFAQSPSKERSSSNEFNYLNEISNIDFLRTKPSHLIFLSSIKEFEERRRLEYNLVFLLNNIETNKSEVILKITRNALGILADDKNQNKIRNDDLNEIKSSLCKLKINDRSAKYPNWNPEMNSQQVLKQASIVPVCGQFFSEEFAKDIDLKNEENENNNSISQKQLDSANCVFREAPFEEFLGYLIYHKQVVDPDVSLFYGVLENNDSLVNIAFANGGNINVTVDEIIERYKNEYEEYNTTPSSYVRIPKGNGETGNENKQDGEGFGMKTWEFINRYLLFILCIAMVIMFMVTAFNAIRISWKLKRENQGLNNHVDDKEDVVSRAKIEETKKQNEEAFNSAAKKDPVEVTKYKESNNKAFVNNDENPLLNNEECDATGTDAILAREIKQMKEREEENDNKTIKLQIDPLDEIKYHLEQIMLSVDDARQIKTKQSFGKTSDISA